MSSKDQAKFDKKVKDASTNPEEAQLAAAFGCYAKGHLFSVEYKLMIFVKHDSWSEFGEGNCFTLPIKIINRPIDITTTDVVTDIPNGWNPIIG